MTRLIWHREIKASASETGRLLLEGSAGQSAEIAGLEQVLPTASVKKRRNLRIALRGVSIVSSLRKKGEEG